MPEETIEELAGKDAVALLFQPLRLRIQSLTDRRFNRSRYDAQQTIDALAARLRTQADLRELRRDILATASDSVHPTPWFSRSAAPGCRLLLLRS